jgi:molybdate transport system substrate-binding protein
MAADGKVMAGGWMPGAFGELLSQFERATGHKIAIQYSATGTFKKQIEARETFDLVIFGTEGLDDLIKQGKNVGATRWTSPESASAWPSATVRPSPR